jgi:hypothetical protein
MKTVDFQTADILMMFMDAHRNEFHAFAQEFGEHSRRETSAMVTAIINNIHKMLEAPQWQQEENE